MLVTRERFLTWSYVVCGTNGLLHMLLFNEVLGEAEVDELDCRGVSGGLHQPVFQFQIPVHDAVPVHIADLQYAQYRNQQRCNVGRSDVTI